MSETKPSEIAIPQERMQGLLEADNGMKLLMLNWSHSNPAADKLTIGDLKALTELLCQYVRTVTVQHYGHGVRDGSASIAAVSAERDRAQEACKLLGEQHGKAVAGGMAEAMDVVQDANRVFRKGKFRKKDQQ